VPGPKAVTGQTSPYAGSSRAFAPSTRRKLDSVCSTPLLSSYLTSRIELTGPLNSRIPARTVRTGRGRRLASAAQKAVHHLRLDLLRQILAGHALDRADRRAQEAREQRILVAALDPLRRLGRGEVDASPPIGSTPSCTSVSPPRW
jgi:hypothetical protein